RFSYLLLTEPDSGPSRQCARLPRAASRLCPGAALAPGWPGLAASIIADLIINLVALSLKTIPEVAVSQVDSASMASHGPQSLPGPGRINAKAEAGSFGLCGPAGLTGDCAPMQVAGRKSLWVSQPLRRAAG